MTVGIDPQSEVKGKGKTAGLVAYSDCSNLIIDGCINKGKIYTNGNDAYCAGLVAGSINNVNIKDSRNKGNITASGEMIKVGGLVARHINGTLTIENSSNSGKVSCQATGTSTSFSHVGGIVGTANENGNNTKVNTFLFLKNVSNSEEITGTISSGTPTIYTGGIFGSASVYEGGFTECSNSGTVSGNVVGGIGGNLAAQKDGGNEGPGNHNYKENAITLDECINTGSVIGNAKTQINIVCAAGLVGNVGDGYITINNTCSAKDAQISSSVSVEEAATVLLCRLIGNIYNHSCDELTVYIPETFENDTINTFGRIGLLVYSDGGDTSTLKYYGTMVGEIININVSVVTDQD